MKSTIQIHSSLNVERDGRNMGWLMTGQLIQVTIRDGREPKTYLTDTSDTNTETDNFTTTEDDDEDDHMYDKCGYSRQRSKSLYNGGAKYK